MADTYYQLPHGRVIHLKHNTQFPPLTAALQKPNGLIAIGGTLNTERLLAAYQLGIFPWFSEGEPILWWSPDPRMVLFPSELKINRSLRQDLKKAPYEIRFNTAFRQVIAACAQAKRPEQNGTWISPEIIQAYNDLHTLGYVICMESWLDDQLVGGCYGVMIGKMFFGESMFHTEANASKIAFVHLVKHLESMGVGMIDCQMKTPLLTSFGGKEIPRNLFAERLAELVKPST
jgi:leucyl/phenylalanyl-tRNA---protein transferase